MRESETVLWWLPRKIAIALYVIGSILYPLGPLVILALPLVNAALVLQGVTITEEPWVKTLAWSMVRTGFTCMLFGAMLDLVSLDCLNLHVTDFWRNLLAIPRRPITYDNPDKVL